VVSVTRKMAVSEYRMGSIEVEAPSNVRT